jgi:hypothetical protein
MESFVRSARRGGVMLVAALSVLVSLALVYVLFNGGTVARLPTVQLLGPLALLVLPIVTLGLLRLDQTTARERGARRG